MKLPSSLLAASGVRVAPALAPTVLGKPCEPTATRLRVVVSGGGAPLAPISPPTPVCERGSLQVTNLVAA